jgi:hypothetical protein
MAAPAFGMVFWIAHTLATPSRADQPPQTDRFPQAAGLPQTANLPQAGDLPQAENLTPANNLPQAAVPEFDTGNDPTVVRKRITFKNEYSRFANGLAVNTTLIQTSIPILQEDDWKINFGFDLPINYYQVESPIAATLSGVGDMKAQLMGIRSLHDSTTLTIGANLWLPTAEQQLL